MPSPLRVSTHVVVVIEVPRGGFVKRGPDGHVDVASPLPAPFNYGSVPGTVSGDGQPLDAIVLGRRLPRGHRGQWPVRAVFGFVDRGRADPKLVCAAGPLRPGQRRQLERFFWAYTRLKWALQRARGQPEPTEALGWLPWTTRGT